MNGVPSDFPVDLLGLIEEYVMYSASRSFAINPLSPSAGLIRCYIKKTGNQFDLLMERDVQLTKVDLPRPELIEALFDDNTTAPIGERKVRENQLKSTLLSHAAALGDRSTEDLLLLTATRHRKWTGTQYTILMRQSDPISVIGKLQLTFGGAESVFMEPKERAMKMSKRTTVQRVWEESGLVRFDHFFEETGSPIRLKVFIPNQSFYAERLASNPWYVDMFDSFATVITKRSEEQKKNCEETKENDSNVNLNMMAQYLPHLPPCHLDNLFEFEHPNRTIECYENLAPVWHEAYNAYVLHFDNHRIREKSVKNFKLVRERDEEKRTILQFGRVVDRNMFVMDFAYPLTPLQAFQISLSLIDPKR